MLERNHDRSRWAYNRLVWRLAQKFLDNSAIWDAVESIADTLQEDLFFENGPEPGDRAEGIIDGRSARAVMHHYGVRPGMFGMRLSLDALTAKPPASHSAAARITS